MLHILRTSTAYNTVPLVNEGNYAYLIREKNSVKKCQRIILIGEKFSHHQDGFYGIIQRRDFRGSIFLNNFKEIQAWSKMLSKNSS